MSEKLSERFAALLDAKAYAHVGAFAIDHSDTILSALRLSEQPPTDAAGMREKAAETLALAATHNVDNLVCAFGIPEDGADGVKRLLSFFVTAIRSLPLPLSPTADALQVAEEALAEATPILKSFSLVETQFSREGTPLAAFYRCIDALAAIRKTKEG